MTAFEYFSVALGLGLTSLLMGALHVQRLRGGLTIAFAGLSVFVYIDLSLAAY